MSCYKTNQLFSPSSFFSRSSCPFSIRASASFTKAIMPPKGGDRISSINSWTQEKEETAQIGPQHSLQDYNLISQHLVLHIYYIFNCNDTGTVSCNTSVTFTCVLARSSCWNPSTSLLSSAALSWTEEEGIKQTISRKSNAN